MTTYQEVKTLMSLITPYSLPEDDESAFTLYKIAEDKVTRDAPTLTGSAQTEACCFYLAHLLSLKDGSAGIISEQLGTSSVTYAKDRSTAYLIEYRRIIKAASIANIAACMTCRHDDTETSNLYALDTYSPEDI